jgi:hypothetical protein
MASAGSSRTSCTMVFTSRTARRSRCLTAQPVGHTLKSLGLNSRPTSTAKTSAQDLPQASCANASLSGRHSVSMCRANAVVNPQYPLSARPFSSRYAVSFFPHREACNHVSAWSSLPSERNASRATLMVNGPAPWLRRTFVSWNCNGSMSIALRNSGTTLHVIVFSVNGSAISFELKASASAIK